MEERKSKNSQEMQLELAKKKLFEGMEIECYVDMSKDNGDFYMTIDQVSEALGYKDRNGLDKVISRKKTKIGEPTLYDKLSDSTGRKLHLYSFEQFFEIMDGNRQVKANLFRQWTIATLKELITGRAELKFKTQENEEEYKLKIKELENQIIELQDLANGYNKVLIAPNSQQMNNIAKVLDCGRNKLFAFLRKEKILMKDNIPYQQHIKSNHFIVKEQVIHTGEIVPVTYVTGKGLNYIRKRLEKVNYVID